MLREIADLAREAVAWATDLASAELPGAPREVRLDRALEIMARRLAGAELRNQALGRRLAEADRMRAAGR